jgi:TolB-like protein
MTGSDTFSRLQTALAGRYTVERVLGRGGWATVYLAHDAKHARPVALKVLRPDLAAALGPARFLREIAIAGRLTHPHVLPLYDSGEAGGSLYYVMPYIEGETLRQRLERERQLPLADTLAITHQVAEALAFAHSHNVIHRDIKPENILLEPGAQAYLADFGIARAIMAATGDTISEPGLAVGTPSYMSPEQAGGQERLDGRSDLYSLACVVYEMLTGEPPHTGPTAQAILARQQVETPRSIQLLRPTVPEAVERAVLTALAKAPADRFGSVAEFADALAGATRRPGDIRLGRVARRSLLGLGAVLGLGGLIWIAGRASSPPIPPEAVTTRLAVLYFDDRSERGVLRPVADGLTEDLIDELGRVPALRVISPNGVRPFLGRPAPPDSIGRALRVGTLVAGSVERSGDVLRVTVRLIDAGSGLQLDSRTLEYPFHQLFVLQDRLAGEVSRILRQRLGREIVLRERRKGTRSVAAWELAQEGEGWSEAARTFRDQADLAAARRALDAADSLFARASGLDSSWPQPAISRGWLAETRMQLTEASRSDSLEVWYRLGLLHADAALRLRPGDPAAHELRGSLRYRHWLTAGGDSAEVAGAEEDLRAGAEASNPSQPRAWATLSALLQATGRLAEANLLARRAYDADAFLAESPSILFRLYYTSLDLGDDQEASRWCDTGLQRFPEDWRFTFCKLTTLVWRSREQPPDSAAAGVERAWELVRRLERLSPPEEVATQLPRWQIRVAPLLGRAGLRDSAEAVIRRARAAAPEDPEMDFHEAEARVLLGDQEAALRLLARDLAGNPRFREYVRVYPVFRPLWSDPRFQAMVRDQNELR